MMVANSSSTDNSDTLVAHGRSPKAPAVRVFGRRRFYAAFTGLSVLVVGSVLALHVVGRSERDLVTETRTSQREVLAVLERNASIGIPIDGTSDVVRLVLFGVACSGAPSTGRHRATIRTIMTGALGSRTEDADVVLPTSSTRVRSERPDRLVWDPVSAIVDVASMGRGTLTVTLVAAEGACEIGVRALARNPRVFDLTPLGDDENGVVNARWSKVSATALGHEAPTLPVIVLPAAVAPPDRSPRIQARLGPFDARSYVVIEPGSVRMETVGLGNRTLFAQIGERLVSAPDGPVEMNVVAGDLLRVWTSETADVVTAWQGARVEALEASSLFRIEPGHPAIVDTGSEALVLRMSARGIVTPSPQEMRLGVHMGNVNGRVSFPTWSAMPSTSESWVYDRKGLPPSADPLSRVVLVPAHSTVEIRSEIGVVDVAFREQDGEGGPWRPRLPSNAGALASVRILRIPQRNGATVGPSRRQGSIDPMTSIARTNEASYAGAKIPFRVLADRTEHLALRVTTDVATNVTVNVDHGWPRRRAGLALRVTRPRTFALSVGTTTIRFPLGDDLQLGTHSATLSASDSRARVQATAASKRVRPEEGIWLSALYDEIADGPDPIETAP